jgi:hypothetical protein
VGQDAIAVRVATDHRTWDRSAEAALRVVGPGSMPITNYAFTLQYRYVLFIDIQGVNFLH